MKRMVGLALLLLMLAASVCSGAVAETVTATKGGSANIPFSNGYYGYCIDKDKKEARPNENFTVAADTSLAKNNVSGQDVSQKLKVMFTQFFSEIFVADGLGNYQLDDLKADNFIPFVVYGITDNGYIYGEQLSFKERVDNYNGDSIPDEGYQLKLDNGDVVTFYFKVFEPNPPTRPDGEPIQSFFAYKITVASADATKAYNVTFNANGGSGMMADQTFDQGETKNLTKNVFTREGHAFAGWNTQPDGSGTAYADEASVELSGDMTLYAQWTHACGNGELTSGQDAGCEEDGWKDYYLCSCGKTYEDKDCTEEIADLDAWKSGEGKIEADHNYGDLIPATEEKHSETELSPSVAAHYQCSDCGKYFTEDKVETELESLTGETPSHQFGNYQYNSEKHWKECECTLKSDEADHDFESERDTKCDTCGYEREIDAETYTVTATKEGQGTVSPASQTASEKETVILIIEAESNHKLVSLTRDGVDVTDEVSGNIYRFEMPAKDVNIHAVFEANQAPEYTVTVNESENGSVESDKTRAAEDETVTLTVKPDAGYELDTLVVDGQDVTGSVENDQYAFSMPAEDVTVQATFKKIEEAPVIYTVTVTTDGNGTASASPTEGTTGTQVTLSATPNTGYQFKEWQVVSGGVTIENNAFAIGNENVEVKAIFEAIPEAPVTYTVTFDANGGSGTMEIQTFQQGVEQALTMNAFTYEGHVFDGWNIMPDGSGDALADGETLQLAGNITLYAQWKAETVVNPLRIVEHPQDQYVTAGQQAEFSVEAEGDGVTYQWYIDRMDGKGLCVIDGANDQTYVTSTVNPDNDEYLYLCRVTDAHGNTMLSGAAVLHVSALSAMPATGDASAPLLWLAMGMLSMLGMALLGRKAKAE